ncbi:MAG: hypothetical protein CMQ38_06490 [Gammaproteobacteria bacterium]|nr:hypothetical protein [Gammaproteobacteria bacterium]
MKPDSQNSLAESDDMILDEASVASFLLDHPEFFASHEELLAKMIIPHRSGGAISLLERQVALLRRKNEESQDKIDNFIENARENDELFEKTRTVILDIVNTNSLIELSDLISNKLNKDFDATASQLFFAGDPETDSPLQILPLEQTKKVLGKLFQRKRAYCGTLKPEQTELFFPDTPSINSAAIVPIHLQDAAKLKNSLPGIPIMLIASKKPQHFNSSLDTLFLDFIGEVLSAHIKGLLLR